MENGVFTKSFSSETDSIPEIDRFIEDTVRTFKVDEDKITSISLAAAEASSNAIIHGNKLDPHKKVTIIIKNRSNLLEIIIRDEGKGFDPKEVPDPTKPENLLKDNGRGLHIMKTYLDDLKYNFTEKGTETILIIKL